MRRERAPCRRHLGFRLGFVFGRDIVCPCLVVAVLGFTLVVLAPLLGFAGVL